MLFGVPHILCVLEPLLLILYTAALSAIAPRHGVLIHPYADDTQLYNVHVQLKEVAYATKRLCNYTDDAMRLSLPLSHKQYVIKFVTLHQCFPTFFQPRHTFLEPLSRRHTAFMALNLYKAYILSIISIYTLRIYIYILGLYRIFASYSLRGRIVE